MYLLFYIKKNIYIENISSTHIIFSPPRIAYIKNHNGLYSSENIYIYDSLILENNSRFFYFKIFEEREFKKIVCNSMLLGAFDSIENAISSAYNNKRLENEVLANP